MESTPSKIVQKNTFVSPENPENSEMYLLAPAHLGVPDKVQAAVKRLCVCVCVCVCLRERVLYVMIPSVQLVYNST